MTQPQNKKSVRKSSPNHNKPEIPEEFAAVYERDTCQKCFKPIFQNRIMDCKSRRFWPVCEECEIEIVPIYKEAAEKLAKLGF